MDNQKEAKQPQSNPGSVGEQLIAELLKGLGAHFERQNKFQAGYANNFHFEPSVWDLKIIFGQLEQHTGTAEVDWHTAITIPWLQAKLVAYFLRSQVAWHEHRNGPIQIPSFVNPKEPEPPTEEQAKNPANVAWYEISEKIYHEMFGGSKES